MKSRLVKSYIANCEAAAVGYSWKDVQSKLVNIKSDSYWVKIASAINLVQQKKNDEAISTLLKAKKGDFPDPAANYLLSYTYIQQGQVGLARAETEGALSNYTNNTNLLDQGMYLALIGHDEVAAGRYYLRLAKLAEGRPEQLSAGCLYYYGIGKSVEAVDTCSKSMAASPKNHTAHSNLGWAALDADQFKVGFTAIRSRI